MTVDSVLMSLRTKVEKEDAFNVPRNTWHSGSAQSFVVRLSAWPAIRWAASTGQFGGRGALLQNRMVLQLKVAHLFFLDQKVLRKFVAFFL